MKKTKIFLTVAAFVIAVAGVAATKVNSSHKAGPYYYKPSSGCTTATNFCPTQGNLNCQQTEISGDPTLYSVYTDINCNVPLKWDGN